MLSSCSVVSDSLRLHGLQPARERGCLCTSVSLEGGRRCLSPCLRLSCIVMDSVCAENQAGGNQTCRNGGSFLPHRHSRRWGPPTCSDPCVLQAEQSQPWRWARGSSGAWKVLSFPADTDLKFYLCEDADGTGSHGRGSPWLTTGLSEYPKH